MSPRNKKRLFYTVEGLFPTCGTTDLFVLKCLCKTFFFRTARKPTALYIFLLSFSFGKLTTLVFQGFIEKFIVEPKQLIA